jgi:hypothetical protein
MFEKKSDVTGGAEKTPAQQATSDKLQSQHTLELCGPATGGPGLLGGFQFSAGALAEQKCLLSRGAE